MMELAHESLRLINFPFSLLMLIVVGYWLFVIMGVLDLDILHLGAEADVGGHDLGHGDGEAHVEGNGALHGLGKIFHVGEAPVTVSLSVLFTFMWTISMISNYYFNEGDSLLLGLTFLIPNFIVSMIATSIAILPVAICFRKLNKNADAKKDVVGDVATVTTSRVTADSGQVEVATEGAPITVNARTSGPEEILTKGQKVVVVRKNDDGTYIVKSLGE